MSCRHGLGPGCSDCEVEGLTATFHRSPLIPIEWGVTCPVCGTTFSVKVREDDYGAWHGEDEDQLPQCGECEALIEVTPVYIKDFPHDH